MKEKDVKELYRTFHAPVVTFDCGKKCADQNNGVPICCDPGGSPRLVINGDQRGGRFIPHLVRLEMLTGQ